MLPFMPSGTAPVNAAVTSTTGRTALPGKGNIVRLVLQSTQDVAVKFGDVTVDAADTDLLIKGGQKEVYLHRPIGTTHIAHKTATGTNTMNIATGEVSVK